MIKQLTGGDTITARFLYQEPFEFRPQFALWMAANHRPVIRGTDDGIWRRIRLVPFTVQIPEADVEKDLPDILEAELSGILAWAVSGAIQWYQHGLPTPGAIAAATATYREESDILADFLGECCHVHAGTTVGATALFAAYRRWSESRGDQPISNTSFGRKLTDRGFNSVKLTVGTKVRCGLKLRVSDSSDS